MYAVRETQSKTCYTNGGQPRFTRSNTPLDINMADNQGETSNFKVHIIARNHHEHTKPVHVTQILNPDKSRTRRKLINVTCHLKLNTTNSQCLKVLIGAELFDIVLVDKTQIELA